MGTLINPTPQQRLFRVREGFARFVGRHLLVRVVRLDANDQFTAVRFGRNDGAHFQRNFTIIQSQVRFAMILVRTVTRKALAGQQGSNVAAE